VTFSPRSLVALIAFPVAASGLHAGAVDTNQFQVGTLHVECHGDHGTPIILIPGLASGPWAWQATVDHLQNNHLLYVVTLAGFDGTPAPSGKQLIQQANQSLLNLIVTRKIDKPVLVGHSLGGTLSIQFAEQHSDLISGVVSVDGLPIFPGNEQMPPQLRWQMAELTKAQMYGQSPQAFAAGQLDYMRNIGVINEATAKDLARKTALSDPNATASYMAEDLELDLRPSLPHIQVPLLVISPYNAPDFAAQHISEPAKTGYYKSLLKGAPKLHVLSISPSRHFAMFDQPAIFEAILDKYLDSL
jgi:pimeloyl-ACP methyl ester carboxylesterase